ncbi:MAG: beta-ketoacyl synthase [Hyphomonadaceae bacterium]
MGERRIVVTGAGIISAIGASVEEAWANARDGVGGIVLKELDAGPHAPANLTLPIAQPAPGWEKGVQAGLGPRALMGLDPFAAYALAASYEALAQAGLAGAPALMQRAAIVLGHGMGGLETLEKGFERFYGMKSPRMHPTTVPRVMVSAAASAVAMAFGVRGVVFATSSACASSAHAIAQGAALLKAGLADIAIVGGSEAVATPGSMQAWKAIHALSESNCRPFSIDRDGMVMGEGAGALILEEAGHARARGAPILAELTGMGMTSDAFHITQPSLEGPVEAIRQAIGGAGLSEAGAMLISAHGTGTPINDQNEAAAIKAALGARAMQCPVIATKSAHGHLIGGAAVVQAALGLKALETGLAPPILNSLGPDPACDIDLVLGAARPIDAKNLLVNAFAFGGLNACLVFTRDGAML